LQTLKLGFILIYMNTTTKQMTKALPNGRTLYAQMEVGDSDITLNIWAANWASRDNYVVNAVYSTPAAALTRARVVIEEAYLANT
jgi:hypothetical protein